MSRRVTGFGSFVTVLYAEIGFDGATPGWRLTFAPEMFRSLPPTRAPYFTGFPPPETTPLSTVRPAPGAPSLADASPSSAWRASAPTLRIFGPVPDIAFEPPSPPVLTATQVSACGANVGWFSYRP